MSDMVNCHNYKEHFRGEVDETTCPDCKANCSKPDMPDMRQRAEEIYMIMATIDLHLKKLEILAASLSAAEAEGYARALKESKHCDGCSCPRLSDGAFEAVSSLVERMRGGK